MPPISYGTDIDHPYIQQCLPLLPIMVIFCLLDWTLHRICVVKENRGLYIKCFQVLPASWLSLALSDPSVILCDANHRQSEQHSGVLGTETASQA